MTRYVSQFWRQRAARQRWLRFALGAVVLVVVVGTSVSVGVASRQPDLAIRSGLTSASADDNSMVWKRILASNSSAQDAATRAHLGRAMAGAPVTITSSAVADALPLDSGALVLPLRDDASLRAATSGMPVLGPGEVAVDDAGARALGVVVGDVISVQDGDGIRDLKVAALWRVIDSRSPIWNGIGGGASGTTARIALAPAETKAEGITLTARWSIEPDPMRVRAADLQTIEAGFARLAAEPLTSGSFAELDGGGAETVASLRTAVAAAATVVPFTVALLSAGAFLAILLLVQLLARTRAEETALLRARGGSRGQIAAADVRAALVPVMLPAIGGGIVAQILLWLLVAPPVGWVELLLPVIVPAAVALLAVAAASTAPAGAARGRALAATRVAGAALLGVLAVVGVFRLVSAGIGADPAAELAPALVVAAIIVLGLVIGPVVVAAADAVERGGDGISAMIAMRRLRQRQGLVVGALVLVAFAVGSAGFAAGVIPSSTDFIRGAGRLITGGDVNVQGGDQPSVAVLARSAGATAAAPALSEPATLGDVDATFAAAPTSRLSGLQDAKLADLPALAATVGKPIGIPLTGSGPLRLRVRVSVADAAADTRVELTAYVVRADSGVERLVLPDAAIGTDTVESTLGTGGPARLVAIDAVVRSTSAVDGLGVRVTTVGQLDSGGRARTAPLPDAAWTLTPAITAPAGTAASGTIGWATSGPIDSRKDGVHLGRLMPSGSAVVPVAFSQALSSALGIGVGGRADIGGAISIAAKVATIVPQTVGSDGSLGVWADLPTLQTTLLRLDPDLHEADHVWLAVDDPVGATARILARDPGATVSDSPVVTMAPLAQPVIVGILAAAIGTLLFALLAIATVVTSLMRDRRGGIGVLRALGASTRIQRATARIELFAVLGYAVVIGAAAAVVAVIVTVPFISHALTPGIAAGVGVPITVDPTVLGAAIVVLAAGVLIGLGAQERIIVRFATLPDSQVQQ
ncbi:MAG: hypothetical protein JWN80_2627 [Microbacteriaceae bacterium]|nr:hypothetical protein [Microbacteriaceae bacterium]